MPIGTDRPKRDLSEKAKRTQSVFSDLSNKAEERARKNGTLDKNSPEQKPEKEEEEVVLSSAEKPKRRRRPRRVVQVESDEEEDDDNKEEEESEKKRLRQTALQ